MTMTTVLNQIHWMQLVLFPELLGVVALPLDQCHQPQAEEHKEPRHSLEEALAAGQIPLWETAPVGRSHRPIIVA